MVPKSISILKRKGVTINQGFAIINKTVIVGKALEDLWIDEMSRAKPSTVDMNSGDITASVTGICDLNRVCWYAIWKRVCGSLVNNNVCCCAFLVPHSVWFFTH